LNKKIENFNLFRDNFHLVKIEQQLQIQEAEIMNLKRTIDYLNNQIIDLNQSNQELKDLINIQISINQEQSILINKLEIQLSQKNDLASPNQCFQSFYNSNSSTEDQTEFNTTE
jgi:hypothetical protein